MPARSAMVALVFVWSAFSQDDAPALIKHGDAAYLKGDYEAARASFSKAWEAVQQTPRENPARYDVLKRLTNVRAAVGEFADADQWLQQALTWRETVLGKEDPKIADDLLLSAGFYRNLKDYDRALLIMRRVQDLHAGIYGTSSPLYADDFSRMAGIYADQKELQEAIAMH